MKDIYLQYVYSMVSGRFPDAPANVHSDLSAKLILNCAKGEEEGFLSRYDASSDLSQTLTSEFLEELNELNNPLRKMVMFLWNHDAVESPLGALYDEVKDSAEFNWVYAVTSDELGSSRALSFAKRSEALFVPYGCERYLTDLFAVISTDGFLPPELPSQVYRLAIVHGLILEDSWSRIDHYFHFLAGMFNGIFYSAKLNQENNQTHYQNVFPKQLIGHESAYFDVVEGGYAKLDQLYRLAHEAGVKDKVVFHLPSITYAKYQPKHLSDILSQMIEQYPEFEISIRPFPGQYEQYRQLADTLSSNKNVSWDLDDNYVNNYKDARLLITSNSHSKRTFALGTGRPAIDLDFTVPGDISEKPFGYEVCQLEDLLPLLGAILSPGYQPHAGIRELVSSWANPGNSGARLVEHLTGIVHGRSDARYRYSLYSAEDSTDTGADDVLKYVHSNCRLPARAEWSRVASAKYADFEFARHALALRISYLKEQQLGRTDGFPIEQISQFMLQFLLTMPDSKEGTDACEKLLLPLMFNALIAGDSNVDFEYCKKLLREKMPHLGELNYRSLVL